MMRIPIRLALIGVALSGAALPAVAQQPDTAAARRAVEQQLGRPVSQAEILERIRASGLTRAEAKARLRMMGYDPSMVDPYYDALEQGRSAPAGTAPEEFARALSALNPSPAATANGVKTPRDTVRRDTPTARPDPSPQQLPLFGRELFEGVTTEFDPVLYGPVDEGYRVGPGDEVHLVLTGGVEEAYALQVNRRGYLIVPEVGQLAVNGMTLDQLESGLGTALGRVYAGVRGSNPSIQFQVSLGELRTNQVFIVGEVERPGSYQVSAVSSVFNALYHAGGPSESGSFRRIEVWRGGDVVRTIDLYDYLISGDSGDDIRLAHGDRIHVPLSGPRVAIRGAVRRPARYELRPDEGMAELLRYAGGFAADALVRRVQVDRVVPPHERRPGTDDRRLLDVNAYALLQGDARPMPLRDGDVVEVFAVSDARRNRVSIEGGVQRPGTYEWMPGTTLRELIQRADGLQDAAYTARAHVYRLNRATGTRQLLRVPLATADGEPRDLALADRDSVVVYSRSELANPRVVYVDGFVKEPGSYPLAEGMTLRDLVLAAGGFSEGAYTAVAEVARRAPAITRSDTTAQVIRVPLGEDPRLGSGGEGSANGSGGRLVSAGGAALAGGAAGAAGSAGAVGDPEAPEGVDDWVPTEDEFLLRHEDRVFIRKAPSYVEVGTVAVTGQVEFPGAYALTRREERLAEVLRRAGGFTAEAYVPGIQILREGQLVAVDAEEALRDPNSHANLVLQPGDSLQVPSYEPTVLVQGAVNFESRVLYQPGRGLDYYISRAGGFQDQADREGVSVTQQNGERSTVGYFLMMQRAPEITPGSTVFVPALPPAELAGFSLDTLLTRTVSIASVTATLLIAISQFNN